MYVSDLDLRTHVDHLGDISVLVAKLIAAVTHCRAQEVELDLLWPEEISGPLKEAERLHRIAAESSAAAAASRRALAEYLYIQCGERLDDIGLVLGVSRARAHDILHDGQRRRREAKRKAR